MPKDHVKIQWLTKSPAMQSYFDDVKDFQFTGGTLYEIDAINSIKKEHHISINSEYIKNENALKFFFKNHKQTIDADICVIDPYVMAFNKVDYSKYNIAIIHHIDESFGEKSFFGKLFLKQLLKNLRKVDMVVVVSEFWKSYLEERKVKNVKVIYNAYELSDFQFNENDIESLRDKLNLDPNKPTIYLGKIGHGKGIDKILEYLDHSKFNLVTSGKGKVQNENVKSFFLKREEFPMLLKISDVVLAMSTMPEGWNRIAHEALLVKTPVIGSGTGGMKELLEKSGQKVVTNFSDLENEIQHSISNKNYLGNLGFDFVKQLDMDYFQSEWLGLIDQVKQKLK